jgi:hypothetical protein
LSTIDVVNQPAEAVNGVSSLMVFSHCTTSVTKSRVANVAITKAVRDPAGNQPSLPGILPDGTGLRVEE